MKKGKVIFYESKNGVIDINFNRMNLKTVTRKFGVKTVVKGSPYYKEDGSKSSRHEPFWSTMTFAKNSLRIVIEKDKINDRTQNTRIFNDMPRVPLSIKPHIKDILNFKGKEYEVQEIWDDGKVDSNEFPLFEKVEFIITLGDTKIPKETRTKISKKSKKTKKVVKNMKIKRKGKIEFYDKNKNNKSRIYFSFQNLNTLLRNFGINKYQHQDMRHEPFFGELIYNERNTIRLIYRKKKMFEKVKDSEVNNSRNYNCIADIPNDIYFKIRKFVVFRNKKYKVHKFYDVEEVWTGTEKVEFIIRIRKPEVKVYITIIKDKNSQYNEVKAVTHILEETIKGLKKENNL